MKSSDSITKKRNVHGNLLKAFCSFSQSNVKVLFYDILFFVYHHDVMEKGAFQERRRLLKKKLRFSGRCSVHFITLSKILQMKI